jgi:DegV family protein with EDD domain
VPVAVVTDSAAAIPLDLAASLGIVRVPMQLTIGGRARSEGEVSLEELVAHLDEGVQTSGPAPGAFLQAIEEADHGEGVLVLTVAKRFSSTYESARTAASLRAASNAGVPPSGPSNGGRPSMVRRAVRVVDTGTAAGAQGLVVLAAARRAASGGTLDEVEAAARAAMRSVHLVAVVEELRYLARGGRLPATILAAAGRLGLRVLFELRGSKVRPLRPAMSEGGATNLVLAQWRASRPEHPAPRLHVSALHAMREEQAEALLAAVRQEVEPATAYVARFGPVMVAHTGPGVTGLAWWWEVATEPT